MAKPCKVTGLLKEKKDSAAGYARLVIQDNALNVIRQRHNAIRTTSNRHERGATELPSRQTRLHYDVLTQTAL